jgi:ABC-type transport system involved in multi-copper enzyme maturation permease subunit
MGRERAALNPPKVAVLGEWSAVGLIMRYGVRSAGLSLGPYVMLALAIAITVLALRNTLQVISGGYLAVLFAPFVTPLLIVSMLAGLYLALNTGLSVARERELGTLATLFCGPITYHEYLLGKLLASGLLYLIFIALYLAVCAALGVLAHLVISPLLLAIAALGLVTALALVCLSLVCAACMRTARGAVLLFLGLVLVLTTLQVAKVLLVSIVSDTGFVNLVVLRDMMSALDAFVGWFSPIAYPLNGADAALHSNFPTWALSMVLALAYALLGLQLATRMLRKNGVLQ